MVADGDCFLRYHCTGEGDQNRHQNDLEKGRNFLLIPYSNVTLRIMLALIRSKGASMKPTKSKTDIS